jgi:glycerol-3-phosphate dehydrogenase (NAD(P)+)
MMKKIAVLEPGAWGTALGIILSRHKQVSFWYGDKKLSLRINKDRENDRLSGTKIPDKISVSSDLKKTIQGSDLIIIASPSFDFRKTVEKLKRFKRLPPILGIAKGLEKETLFFPSNIVKEILGKHDYAHLSGPGFAKKVVRGTHAKEVIACRDHHLLDQLKHVFTIHPLDPLTTNDLIGVELAGAMKNALSIGISLVEADIKGKKIERIKRGLIKSGVKEMMVLGKAMGAEKKTFSGPAGKGDLMLTATNPLSRNFQFGKRLLFDGETMRREIRRKEITVEGFNNAFGLYKLGRIYRVDLPMINEIYKVIFRKASPRKTIKKLVSLI